MFYAFKQITDEFGHEFVIRYGKATNDIKTIQRQLQRIQQGEVRDDHNRILAVKSHKETRWVRDLQVANPMGL